MAIFGLQPRLRSAMTLQSSADVARTVRKNSGYVCGTARRSLARGSPNARGLVRHLCPATRGVAQRSHVPLENKPVIVMISRRDCTISCHRGAARALQLNN